VFPSFDPFLHMFRQVRLEKGGKVKRRAVVQTLFVRAFPPRVNSLKGNVTQDYLKMRMSFKKATLLCTDKIQLALYILKKHNCYS